jgi:DNA-binding CsgD family transcriptional regulator
MELSPTDSKLNLLERIDLYKTDEKYDFKLTEILRKRQRPLLMLLDERAELLYSSRPSEARTPNGAAPDPEADARFLDDAVLQAQRLFHEQLPVAAVVKQLVINKPGERCALVILDNQFYCLRLFKLEKPSDKLQSVYAALLEAIGKPHMDGVDFKRVKGLFRLSKREVDVLDALMLGDTDKQIAGKLGVSVETVRAYLKSIRAKLGVQTRTAIVSAVHSLQVEGVKVQ